MSKNEVPIRLTSERWYHISTNHDEVAGYYDDILLTVENPEYIKKGYKSSLIAIKHYGRKGYLNVIYKEISKSDGFIITAYFSKSIEFKDKNLLWQKK